MAWPRVPARLPVETRPPYAHAPAQPRGFPVRSRFRRLRRRIPDHPLSAYSIVRVVRETREQALRAGAGAWESGSWVSELSSHAAMCVTERKMAGRLDKNSEGGISGDDSGWAWRRLVWSKGLGIVGRADGCSIPIGRDGRMELRPWAAEVGLTRSHGGESRPGGRASARISRVAHVSRERACVGGSRGATPLSEPRGAGAARSRSSCSRGSATGRLASRVGRGAQGHRPRSRVSSFASRFASGVPHSDPP